MYSETLHFIPREEETRLYFSMLPVNTIHTINSKSSPPPSIVTGDLLKQVTELVYSLMYRDENDTQFNSRFADPDFVLAVVEASKELGWVFVLTTILMPLLFSWQCWGCRWYVVLWSSHCWPGPFSRCGTVIGASEKLLLVVVLLQCRSVCRSSSSSGGGIGRVCAWSVEQRW